MFYITLYILFSVPKLTVNMSEDQAKQYNAFLASLNTTDASQGSSALSTSPVTRVEEVRTSPHEEDAGNFN